MKSEYVASGSTEDKSLNFVRIWILNLLCMQHLIKFVNSSFFREEKENKKETKDEQQIKE